MSESVSTTQNITAMLQEWNDGNREALDTLLPIVYDELRRQAHRYIRRERKNHTLQTTALIHEAYLKLLEQRNVECESRTHFFAIAANLMRQILVDYARTKQSLKRGGAADNLPLEEAVLIAAQETDVDLLALDAALNCLAEMDARQSRIVELRYFSGLSIAETAEVLQISPTTVKRDWNVAKAFLNHELSSRKV
ncbi:MAG: sigma-70 family RNA polymerase sigma factor [Acidobacteriota bacterium]|nr:sigma-70 family RNA polymerase sigma factor [Acidobacteriota bacterium]